MDARFSCANAVAIVSGGASGIGKAIAAGLLAAGARVTILDLDRVACDAVADEFNIPYPGMIAAECCDLRKASSTKAALDSATAKFGMPDFLVNSVAVTARKPALELTDPEIDNIFATNFSGVFRLCRMVAEKMLVPGGAAARRKILNIASTGAFQGSRNFSAYNASKAALVSLTKVLANEWYASGINVNALCPGPTNTPFVRDYYAAHPEIVSGIISKTPAGRIAEPEDFVGPALFLLSSASDWITGEAIICDGGKSLNG